MAYSKTNWSNDVAPEINAANMNKIEQGIAGAHTPPYLPHVQYVHPTSGDNSNDGASWQNAKATIQAAHDALASAGADGLTGGTIVLSRGKHPADNVVFTTPTKLEGQGVASTQLEITTASAVALELQSDGSIVRDLSIIDSVSGGEAGGGVLLNGVSACVLDNVWLEAIAATDTLGKSFDTSPYAIKVTGAASPALFNKFNNLRIRQCYRGILVDGATSGFFQNFSIIGQTGLEEAIYIRNQLQSNGQGETVHYWANGWVSGGPYSGYQIRMEADIANSILIGRHSFSNLNLELTAAARGRHFVYCDTRGNRFGQVRFIGGGWTDGSHSAGSGVTPNAAYFGTQASAAAGSINVIGVHTVVDTNGTPEFHAASADAAVIHQGADYSGTPSII